MARRSQYTIWQWNCRGYRRKRRNLQQFLNGKEAPDVIALQESGGMVKLSNYKSYGSRDEKTSVTTLVQRNLTVIEHDTEIRDVDHVLVELVPSQKSGESLFILNVYSSPIDKRPNLGSF